MDKQNKMANILFICRYNRFRSRTAEAYFKQINKNKSLKAKSAGIFKGDYPLEADEVAVTKKLGIDIDGQPNSITEELMRWQDTLIIVADDVPKDLFVGKKYAKKVIAWNIPDSGMSKLTIEDIINKIKENVKYLVNELGNNEKQGGNQKQNVRIRAVKGL